MISARGLCKSFGSIAAVRDVSFDIPPGQVVGLLGPNGAGKTTTIRMLTGYLPPSAGEVSICGHDTIDGGLAARRSIGYLPEATPLYPEMRVRDYLRHRARLYGLGFTRRKQAVGRTVERCWLKEVERRRIGQLSKGYRQRVGLAAAILHDPPVVILDEPTSGLDPSQIRQTRTLIRELAKNKTVLVSSHILPEVEKTCDRVIIIARGRVRADWVPSNLIARVVSARPPMHYVELLADARAEHWPIGKTELERIMTLVHEAHGVAAVTHDKEPVPLDESSQSPPGVAWFRLAVMPEAGKPDVREAVARALGSAGILYRELVRREPTLEQIFMKVIEAEDPG